MSKKTKFHVCTKGKKCPRRGSDDVLRALENEIARRDLADRCSVKGTKCLDLCKKGPAVVVTPDKVSYGSVEASDCAEIVKAHVDGLPPVKRLIVKRKKK